MPEPRPGQGLAEYARELKVWLEKHLAEVHQELDRLHEVKADNP